MSKTLKEKASFDFIRYANCWEDAAVLLKGLSPQKKGRILSIGSAGDNSFSLLLQHPGLVVAVDINMAQLYLVELKKTAMRCLDYLELLGFLGFRATTDRLATFDRIKDKLQAATRHYWEQNRQAIDQGIIHAGKFESYFRLFSKKIIPFIHSAATTQQLLAPKSAEEQHRFYHKKWNNLRWRLLFRLFFSKYVMGRYGRDPEFLKEVNIHVGTFIFKQAERQLESLAAQDNGMLRYNLTGNFGTLLPHYLQEENYTVIKQNLERLHLYYGYAEEAGQHFGKFDYMNLSNIFEYMNPQQFRQTAEALVGYLKPGGRLAYWNLMVPRKVSDLIPTTMDYLQSLSESLSAADKGFYYHKFIIEQHR